MIAESVVTSFVVGVIRKGHFWNFGVVKIRGIWLFAIGALIQFVLFRFASWEALEWQKWLAVNFLLLHVLSYILILIPLMINRQFKSLYVMGIGTILNLIPIGLNAGKMPVKVPENLGEQVFDLGHALLTETTKVPILADIFYIGPPYPLPKIISIGDVFLIVGVFWFIQQVLVNESLKKCYNEMIEQQK